MQPFRQQETDRLSAGGFLLPRVEGGPPRKLLPYPLREALSLLCENFRPSLVKRSKSIILFAKQ